jgi:hypothetical protein
MAEFRPGVPIVSDTPDIDVTVSPAAPLPVGRHRFQLVVVDDSGNESEPAVHEVIVRDTTRPTAVIDGPRAVDAGRSFQLSGRRSSDPPPGRIVRYQWMLLA